MAKTEKESRDLTQAEQKGMARRRGMFAPFEDIDRMFEDFFRRGWLSPFRMELPTRAEAARPFEGRTPRVDLIDRDEDIVLRAELPGVDKKDLSVSMTDNMVTLNAKTSYEHEEEEASYYRCEMSHGEYSRTVSLPTAVDESKTKAKFENGILELSMPKLEKAKRRTIDIE